MLIRLEIQRFFKMKNEPRLEMSAAENAVVSARWNSGIASEVGGITLDST
jgi:hypothetical protein